MAMSEQQYREECAALTAEHNKQMADVQGRTRELLISRAVQDVVATIPNAAPCAARDLVTLLADEVEVDFAHGRVLAKYGCTTPFPELVRRAIESRKHMQVAPAGLMPGNRPVEFADCMDNPTVAQQWMARDLPGYRRAESEYFRRLAKQAPH
ncbi:MAG: hypothetical protein ABSE73_12780 [Planctomycetota bacterium]